MFIEKLIEIYYHNIMYSMQVKVMFSIETSSYITVYVRGYNTIQSYENLETFFCSWNHTIIRKGSSSVQGQLKSTIFAASSYLKWISQDTTNRKSKKEKYLR